MAPRNKNFLPADQHIEHERQAAMRALLRRPLLAAVGSSAEEFVLVRRHGAWLRHWLYENTGWSLRVDSEVARLLKTPADLTDPTRGASDPKDHEETFTRRTYVFLCLALAALERSERQTTLGALLTSMSELAAEEPALAGAGIDLDMRRRDVRQDLVRAALLLQELGVLTRIDGDEQQYVQDRGDVLYNISRQALTAMLGARRGPSMIDANDLDARLEQLTEEPLPDTEDARNRRLRWALTRRLIDDPVLYYDELEPDAREYFKRQRPKLVDEVVTATGLVPEIRGEGIAMVDDRGDGTDLGLPEEGTLGHVTLLLAEQLAHWRREHPGAPIGRHELQERTARLIQQFGQHWRADAREPGAEMMLTEAVLRRLEALHLVRWDRSGTPETVTPLPAIHRFALAPMRGESGAVEPAPPRAVRRGRR